MNQLERRLQRLERPETGHPTAEDWLDVLDAPDQRAAQGDLERRFPSMASPGYRGAWEALA